MQADDRDEYGQPVTAPYHRLGAGRDEAGLYVRFEPGFGLNVEIGHRVPVFSASSGGLRPHPDYFEDRPGIAMSGEGWERLCTLVDEWRERTRI